MKGYVITQHISPSELKLSNNVPLPKLAAGQVLLKVHVAATNFFDLLQVQGKYQHQPAHPYIAGCEFAGTVVGEGGAGFKAGDKVFGAGQGAFAEFMAVAAEGLVRIPAGMSFAEASGLFITYPTSYAALVYRANVQPGEVVLIHACAGGVGLAALQIAKALGAIVIATAGSQEKMDICKRYGADYAVNYTGDAAVWQKEVKRITKGRGVDVVYDPVGMIIPSLKVIAWNGRIVVVGFAGGNIEKIPSNLILLKNIAVTGVHWGAYTKNEPSKIAETWEALLKLFAEKKIRGVVYDSKSYNGLESVPEALRALGARETWGKVVVRVAEPESKL